ncbi:MAG: DNA polymerase/3'-5' exonuclease PolX [Nitrospirota bacterium]
MKNREVARIFNEMAVLLEVKGENPFRVRAYRRAAQNIEGYPRAIEEASPEEILSIAGIGPDLAGKVREIAETGKLKAMEDLKKEVPGGFAAMLSVPGLGPRTAKLVLDRFGTVDLEGLEELAREHRLAGLPGVGAKTERNILKGIETLRLRSERHPLGLALPAAEDILRHLGEKAPVTRIALAGSLRRWKETVKDMDILATSPHESQVMNAFVHLPHVKEVLMKGPTKTVVVLDQDIQVDLRVVREQSFGSALCYFTGSKAHNIRLREMAVRRGLKLNEYGVFDAGDGRRLGGEREEDVYEALGLAFVPPELREDRGEVEAAQEDALPHLVQRGDIRGDLHVHTRWSDGKHSLEEVVQGARRRGFEYIAITDHSKGLGVARGLTEKRLREEVEEIEALNERLQGFRVLTGTEVDIRSDGTLDFPDRVLESLDVVVASIHSGFNQPMEKLTGRLIAAMRNPHVDIIAHPTGRIIGERDAYEVDMEAFLEAARQTGTALEINAYPLRLDLSDTYARAARAMGIPLVISTDTHLLEHFDHMAYGVSVARRGWLEKDDVLNTKSAAEFLKALGKRP